MTISQSKIQIAITDA